MPKGLPDSFILTGALRLSRSLKRGFPRAPSPRNRPLGYKVVSVTLYQPLVDYMLRNSFGEVGRYVHKIANRVAQRARRQVGVKTGRLRSSIKFKHVRIAGEAAVKIGAYTHYALMHHNGTKPHIITPNKPGGQLVFLKGSRIIRTPIVRHPGTKPNRYLTDQIRPSIRRQILR